MYIVIVYVCSSHIIAAAALYLHVQCMYCTFKIILDLYIVLYCITTCTCISVFIVSMRLMYEVHCSQFFGSLESDDFRTDSPVDNFGQCRNVC